LYVPGSLRRFILAVYVNVTISPSFISPSIQVANPSLYSGSVVILPLIFPLTDELAVHVPGIYSNPFGNISVTLILLIRYVPFSSSSDGALTIIVYRTVLPVSNPSILLSLSLVILNCGCISIFLHTISKSCPLFNLNELSPINCSVSPKIT